MVSVVKWVVIEENWTGRISVRFIDFCRISVVVDVSID